MLTFGSLFAGIGGMDLGLERAGLQCVWQVEKDEFCQRVLAKHWPDVRRWDDVCTFPPAAEAWRADFVVGGDPCQANSAAAAASSATSLGGEFVRILDEIRPLGFLRENPTHTRTDAPWPWWRFRAAAESLGYSVLPFRLRACCVGAFHERDRLFLLGVRPDANSNGLEGWKAISAEGRHAESPGFLEAKDWMDLYADDGFASRAGLSDYVARCRACGNAILPHVAERIGRWIIDAVK